MPPLFTYDLTPEQAAEWLDATRGDPRFANCSRWTQLFPSRSTSPAAYARRIDSALNLGVSPVCRLDPVLLTSLLLAPLEHDPAYHGEPAEAVAALRDVVPPAELGASWRVIFGRNLLHGLVKLDRPAPISVGFVWPTRPSVPHDVVHRAISLDELHALLAPRLAPRRFTAWRTLRTILANRARWPAGVPSDCQPILATPLVCLTADMLTPAELPDATLDAACDAAEAAIRLCKTAEQRQGLKIQLSWLAWPLFATAGRLRPIAPWLTAWANAQPIASDGLPTASLHRRIMSVIGMPRQPHTEVVRRIVNDWVAVLQTQLESGVDFERAAVISIFNSMQAKK